MKPADLQFGVERHLQTDSYHVTVGVDMGDFYSVAQPLALEQLEYGKKIANPTMIMSKDSAQRLMDELWHAGVRPTFDHTKDILTAQNAHMETLKALVEKAYDVELPK